MIKTYSELIQFETFIERYNYLKLCSSIGIETFGHSRYINQILYRSEEWKSFRREIIIRDNGCDLGVEGFDITGTFIVIHHISSVAAGIAAVASLGIVTLGAKAYVNKIL